MEYNLPFEGTPWNSDQEIYDFASQKRFQLCYEWDDIHTLLKTEGLDNDYAEGIIANLKEQEIVAKRKKKKRIWTAVILYIVWPLIAYKFFMPLCYLMSPEHAKPIYGALVFTGLVAINRYRKGELC